MAKKEQRAYNYYLRSTWCPLFGPLITTTHAPNSTVTKAFQIIDEARQLWKVDSEWVELEEIESWDSEQLYPEIFEWDDFPIDLLQSARRIFFRGDIVERTRLYLAAYDRSLWGKAKNGDSVLLIDGEQVPDSYLLREARHSVGVRDDIEDWQVFTVLAISQAHWVLREILEGDPPCEDEDSPAVLKRVATAQAFLSRATEIKLQIGNEELDERLKEIDQKKRGARQKGGNAPGRLPGIVLAVRHLMQHGRDSYSAERLWNYFETCHKGRENPLQIGGYSVYFNYDDTEDRLFQIAPDGKIRSIVASTFRRYPDYAREEIGK